MIFHAVESQDIEIMKKNIYFADLTHTARGIHSSTFPLGAAYVCSYAKKALGNDFEIKLFKFPDKLCQALIDGPSPSLLALSNYCWNLELSYNLSSWAKQRYPDLIVVFGGPNFPFIASEKKQFLMQRPAIDFYVQHEGEVGFVELVKKIQDYSFDIEKLKNNQELIINCNYVVGEQLIESPTQRIKDLGIVPSPYLTGILDEFFELPLTPMIETTRGCPFSCIYCADGVATKNKVARFDHNKIKEELEYISKRIRNIDELIITDLNFGMYNEDITTAQCIAEIQKKYSWPVLVKGSAGKNKPERIIEIASILNNSWVVGSSLQSSDKGVLKNINRNNISIDAFNDFIRYTNKLSKDAMTYTEIILALPGDTKKTHFESLRYGIESGARNLRMYQAILLSGTDMATQETRNEYELITKFRVIPGCVGIYKFGDKEVSVAEIEEIIVGSKDMSFEDYVSCRIMNLFIETYINNSVFEELFSSLVVMNVSVFNLLVYLHEHDELYTPKMNGILKNFVRATKNDLYNSCDEAKRYVLTPDVIKRYISGELGINELLTYKTILYLDLEDTSSVLLKTLKNYLRKLDMLNDNAEEYFGQLMEFVLCKKKNFYEYNQEIEKSFSYDFEAIERLNHAVDPRTIRQTDHQISFQFFHNQAQKERIQNSLNLYLNTPSGIARMMQRTNLKMMYRNVCKEKEKKCLL